MVWEQVNEVLTEAQVILVELQAYRGAGEEIRQVTWRTTHNTRHTHGNVTGALGAFGPARTWRRSL